MATRNVKLYRECIDAFVAGFPLPTLPPSDLQHNKTVTDILHTRDKSAREWYNLLFETLRGPPPHPTAELFVFVY